LAAAAVWLGVPSHVTADRSTRSAQPEGLQESPPSVHAFVNARVVVSPGKRIEKGTVVVRDGVIEAVGDDVKPPADARVWDLAGKTVYPGLIDAYGELAEPAAPPTPAAGEGGGGAPGGNPAGGGELLRPSGPAVAGGAPYWNARVTPQIRAAEAYRADAETNKKLRSQGVVARLVAPNRQIVKGTSAAVSTNDGDPAQLVLRPDVAMHVRLSPPPSPGGESRAYPNSPMGAYALVRQAILDARWYAKARGAWELDRSLPRPEQNDALAALGPAAHGKLPLYVDAPDELYALRADRLAKEFDLPAIVRGSGQEYRRLPAVAAGKRPVVVPLNFARAPNVANPEQAMAVTLDELMDWDLQPENPARLDRAGVKLALTSHGLRDRATFLAAVRKAVKRGLEKDSALRALTTTPAELLGIEKTHGTIEKGRSASFVVTDGDLLADKTLVLETWVDGKRHEVTPTLSPDPRGTWLVAWGEGDEKGGGGAGGGGGGEKGKPRELKVTGTPTKLAGRFALSTGPATKPAGPTTGPATKPTDVELANLAYLPARSALRSRATGSGSAAG
jgi:N-acetylglucosamine-6-phosphate deacetylase